MTIGKPVKSSVAEAADGLFDDATHVVTVAGSQHAMAAHNAANGLRTGMAANFGKTGQGMGGIV